MGKRNQHNRLGGEKSPYLLQHAENPVDWYPWGPEAFEKAKKENKPIFLSIGYSTCHWCHVMEKESFEDAETAKLLNEVFVSVKVDREERPDIDTIYMNVCQLITGSGGWPLTILLTPEGKPFFAGTYLPKTGRRGELGLMELALRIKDLWNTKNQELLQSAEQIMKALRQEKPVSGEELGVEVLELARQQLEQNFDWEYGGFGESMKFPTPHNLFFLLRYWKRTGDPSALAMVEKTIQAMRRGGIYDHIGFGFHRYTVDRQWVIPHFEKMLYDQALIAIVCLEAGQATGKGMYGETAREIFTYVLRDMTHPEGGFYCGQDADSEGQEGKYYLWTEEEIEKVLTKGKAEFIRKVFSVTKEGNYIDPAEGRNGKNILHLEKSFEDLAAEMNLSESNLRKHIEEARVRLYAVREKRVSPSTDDKILADWNALMIAALAKGGRALEEPSFTLAAQKAFGFILHHLRTSDGRLLHRFREGEAAIAGNVNDYVFLTWAALELYETTFEPEYLDIALHLSEILVRHFWDDRAGGFYLTADDASELVLRPKEYYDGAIPSGNSVSLLNFRRLARMTASAELEEKALQIERSGAPMVRKSLTAFTQFLCGVEFSVGPSHEVVIAGNSQGADTAKMLKALQSQFLPNTVVILRPAEQTSPGILRVARFAEGLKPLDSRATAYVCRNLACHSPTTDVDEMLELLTSSGSFVH